MRGSSGADNLALELWGPEFFSEIQKGIFAAAAWYFADASKAEGQTSVERFFEVWAGMQELGSPKPTDGARRALKKFLKSKLEPATGDAPGTSEIEPIADEEETPSEAS